MDLLPPGQRVRIVRDRRAPPILPVRLEQVSLFTKWSNRGLEFQLRAWLVGPRGFMLVLSTARAMMHGLGLFGRANYHNVIPAVPTIHHVIDRARIFHSHGARHRASVSA
jgi:hypothetical protein